MAEYLILIYEREEEYAKASPEVFKEVMDALRAGATPEEIHAATAIDPWFVDQLLLINEVALEILDAPELDPRLLARAKRHGFSDQQIAEIRGIRADVVRGVRWALGLRPVYKTVDTCAAEFEARTPYHYSSYDEETEVAPREKEAVIILGSGPNRIGQGIEFDYSCVHASLALSEAGYETVMVNCNPETVSTDYDTSDRLYFEPLTLEDVLEIVHAEQQAGPVAGVICQLGGQTPLGLAQGLADADLHEIGAAAVGDLALLDEVIDSRGREHAEIEGLAALDQLGQGADRIAFALDLFAVRGGHNVSDLQARFGGRRILLDAQNRRPLLRIEDQPQRFGMRMREEHLLGNRFLAVAIPLPPRFADLMAMNAARHDLALGRQRGTVLPLERGEFLGRSQLGRRPLAPRQSRLE